MKQKNKKLHTIAIILFILGIISIITGIFLLVFSNKVVLLTEKDIKEIKTYKSVQKEISPGAVIVTKDMIYTGDYTYKLIYKTYSKVGKSKEIIEKDTYLEIIDSINKDYNIPLENLKINNEEVKYIDKRGTSKENITIDCDNNQINIKIPANLVLQKNEIIVYVKLNNKTINEKHYISDETYYTFTSSIENDYYNKKTKQSYIIEGEGYIILK